MFGNQYIDNPTMALMQAKEGGARMAAELLAAGIDLSLAPVLDVNKGLNSVIGNRAFHTDPTVVALLARAFMQGMQEAGMAATGKHFPGHGSVTLDSHVALPVDERSLEEVAAHDLIPFAQLIRDGMPAMMAAHIVFPQIDSVPVGFSRIWLHDILRQRLNFTGVIFSDDMNMEGANISTNYADRVLAAREAGCDFVLLCNQRDGVIASLDHVPHTSHQVPYDKWRRLQGDFSRN
jgi:beta-N-acetylhexosaminidase